MGEGIMDGKADTISVIVPVYNVENYVGQCIESIINQSYTELQIILVDDGSTDQSGLICDEYANKDTRIQVIHKSNGGPVSARKAGIDVAIGKYIGFVDGDDYIEPRMYQQLYKYAEEYQVEFVHSGYYQNDMNVVRSTAKEISYFNDVCNRKNILLQLFSFYPNAEFGSNIWSNILKKELIMEHYYKVPVSQVYGEDLIAMCYCVIAASSFVCIPNAFYHYRFRENSISRTVTEKRLLDYYNLYVQLKNILTYYSYSNPIKNSLKERFSILAMQTLAEQSNYFIPKYKYGTIEKLRGKKVVLYGAGRGGQDYYYQICRYQDCKIVGWIDKKIYQFEYANIYSIDVICMLDYDVVLIAVLEENIVEEIKGLLISLGVEKEKIIWDKPNLIAD